MQPTVSEFMDIVKSEVYRLHVPSWQREEIESAGYEAIAKALIRNDLRNPGGFIRIAVRNAMKNEQRRLFRVNNNETPNLAVTLFGHEAKVNWSARQIAEYQYYLIYEGSDD